MSEDQNAIIGILNNLQRDTSQIKTDLAINTTRTGYIEDHLRQLNGKVVKQEERQQQTDKTLTSLKDDTAQLQLSKRRWNDGWLGVLRQFGLFALGLISAFIIAKYF